MGIEFAIDQLYSTGWEPNDPTACVRHSDGRLMPGTEAVRAELGAAGCSLRVRHVQLFDCYQAEWRDTAGKPLGAVVGRTEAEAAVYALSRFRSSLTAAPA